MTVDHLVERAAALAPDLNARLTTVRGTDYYLLSELLSDSEREIRE
jgi:hypothetical protein